MVKRKGGKRSKEKKRVEEKDEKLKARRGILERREKVEKEDGGGRGDGRRGGVGNKRIYIKGSKVKKREEKKELESMTQGKGGKTW